MNTSLIDSAISAAESAPQKSPATPVAGWAGDAEATIQTNTYRTVDGSGFEIIGAIKFPNGFTARKIVRIGEGSEKLITPWPRDIEAAARKYSTEILNRAEKHLERCGFSAFRLVSLLNVYLSALAASGNDAVALTAARPKLAAVYQWAQQVQAAALAGSLKFTSAPHTFEEVMQES